MPTGLVVLAAGAVLMGMPVQQVTGRSDGEKAAVTAVEKLDGTVTVDETHTSKPVVAVSLRATKVADAELTVLKEFKKLQRLDLAGAIEITDAGLKELKEIKSLRTLVLMNTRITDTGLKEFKELEKPTVAGPGRDRGH